MGRLGNLKLILDEKRGTKCEVCFIRERVHCAHVFIGTDNRKGKGFDKFLTVEENCALVCLVCHGKDSVWDENYKRVDTPEFRKEFMKTQIGRGYDMRAWLDGIPEQKQRGDEWRVADLNERD